jgi:hypothetical protein
MWLVENLRDEVADRPSHPVLFGEYLAVRQPERRAYIRSKSLLESSARGTCGMASESLSSTALSIIGLNCR